MRHCDRCHLDYTGEVDRCALCGSTLTGQTTPSPFPVAIWHRLSRTVHRALGTLIVIVVAAAAIAAAAFGLPALLIALGIGIVLLVIAKLLLTQGPLSVKLSKYFSLR
ncbi:hypothetical protein [Adlercreutzia caecimuris]|jgi:ribosomal protein L34E|uniref:hypothetical protein n=1 Tax=Adlercreutzia caecimuris TaxID=671266 RepID=UPI0024952118|nr:hypothetical protein [Adlercreutzia caecimuris]